MKSYAISHVDSFTDTLFRGNPAGVVLDAQGLRDEDMKNIAREMNLSETVFILPGDETCDAYFRYFTSGKYEVKFCGHASIAALSEIARNKLYDMNGEDKKALKIGTKLGIIPMNIDQDKQLYSFEAPRVHLESYKNNYKEFAQRFGINPDYIHGSSPILRDPVLNYLYIPILNYETLSQMTFDFARIKKEFQEENIIVFCLFTPQGIPEGYDIHARGLAPLTGVDEDPFTGSMMTGIHSYVAQYNLLSQTENIRVLQGDCIGRPGSALIANKEHISVSGNAIFVMSSEIAL